MYCTSCKNMCEEVKLLGINWSPASRRVEWALKIKGVEYELIEEDLQNKSPLLLQSNPVHKKIPVLLHNGKPIAESLVIVEYIDETFDGPSILPKDPYDRAVARFWVKFLDEKCLPAVWKALWSKGEEQEKDKEEAYEVLKVLDNELKDNKYFGGEKIGFVDIAANFVGFWIGIVEEATGVKSFPIFVRGERSTLTAAKLRKICLIGKYCLVISKVESELPLLPNEYLKPTVYEMSRSSCGNKST